MADFKSVRLRNTSLFNSNYNSYLIRLIIDRNRAKEKLYFKNRKY